MNEADLLFGFGAFALLAWASWKAFNKIDRSEQMKHENKQGIQMLVMWLIIFGLPAIIVFAITPD